MSDTMSILIADARATLMRKLETLAGKADVDECFATWLVGSSVPKLRIDGALQSAIKASGASRSASAVSILGYGASIREPNDDESRALKSGLSWIVHCDPVVRGTPMPFCMDAVTLAGVVLGASQCDSITSLTDWLSKCRDASAGGQGLGEWQEWLLAIVTGGTGLNWPAKAADELDAAEVRVALHSKGITLHSAADSAQHDEHAVLQHILTDDSGGFSATRAALRLAALDWIRRQRPVVDPRAVSSSDVGHLLHRLSTGLKKWTWEEKPRTRAATDARKWHIENEYHVQNALWLLLAPIFPDLIDEDSTPKVGQLQPRADIGIPSLRLIVEAKFMRANDSPQDMIKQIAEDASLYLVASSRYDGLIPFIWDDSRRTECHDEMVRGLRQIAGVVDSIVIPKPGMME